LILIYREKSAQKNVSISNKIAIQNIQTRIKIISISQDHGGATYAGVRRAVALEAVCASVVTMYGYLPNKMESWSILAFCSDSHNICSGAAGAFDARGGWIESICRSLRNPPGQKRGWPSAGSAPGSISPCSTSHPLFRE
jgi:hypothetical protein